MNLKMVLLLFGLMGTGLHAEAGVYRCVDTQGNTTFSQQPCAPEHVSEKVNIRLSDKNNHVDPAVCEELKLLTQMIYPHIRKKQAITELYEDLGGQTNLSGGVISAVNYVYNFRLNKEITSEEVENLTYRKCQEKGFGMLTTADLPDWDRISYNVEQPNMRIEVATKQKPARK